MTDTIIKRFMSHVAKTDTCWIWTGARQKRESHQYGLFCYGRTRLAHRVSYELFNGDLAPELVVMHSCDNPACVNPAHLKLGTYADNQNDCLQKGRANTARGIQKPNSVLTEEIVRDIRTSGLRICELMKKYGFSRSTIDDVVKGRTWKHIKGDTV